MAGERGGWPWGSRAGWLATRHTQATAAGPEKRGNKLSGKTLLLCDQGSRGRGGVWRVSEGELEVVSLRSSFSRLVFAISRIQLAAGCRMCEGCWGIARCAAERAMASTALVTSDGTSSHTRRRRTKKFNGARRQEAKGGARAAEAIGDGVRKLAEGVGGGGGRRRCASRTPINLECRPRCRDLTALGQAEHFPAHAGFCTRPWVSQYIPVPCREEEYWEESVLCHCHVSCGCVCRWLSRSADGW